LTATCPQCAGPQLPDHLKGLLVFDHDRAACPLGRAEDATAEANLRRAAGWLGPFARPITDAEKFLLAAVGIDPTGLAPQTNVTPISPGILRRHWTEKKGSTAA
jgi:hypothetical protein